MTLPLVGSGRRLALGFVAALAWASPAVAQTSWRIQTAWVNDHVLGAVVGLEARRPIGRVPPRPATGPRVMATRDWMLTGMVAGGVNLDGPGPSGVEALVYAHAGVLRRLGGGLEPRVGVVGAAYIPAGSVGPAARVELLDVAGVQVGWMFDGGLTVGVELVGRFVCDLFC